MTVQSRHPASVHQVPSSKVPSLKFSVPSLKQQVPHPKFYPLSHLGGDAHSKGERSFRFLVPSSPFLVPRSGNGTSRGNLDIIDA